MPIAVPERVECLMDLKQYLFFYVHQNFDIYGNKNKGTIICLVPVRTMKDLIADLKKKNQSRVNIEIGPRNFIAKIIVWLRGFRKL
jgi:hypothetical protein